VGWALGGGFFGRIGDRLGRSRALMLTILTYALFTGLSYFAQQWWHLLLQVASKAISGCNDRVRTAPDLLSAGLFVSTMGLESLLIQRV